MLESGDLKVHLEERSLLERVMKKGIEWEQESSSLLQNVENLWHVNIAGEGVASSLIPRLEHHVLSIDTAIKAGVSLGLEFNMIPKLRDVFSMLKWCISVISFSSLVPAYEVILFSLDNFQDPKYRMGSDWMMFLPSSFLLIFYRVSIYHDCLKC